MDLLTDIGGLALVVAGAFGAGFEFRMIRNRFGHQVRTPGARLFRFYVVVIVCGLVFVSNHWHNSAVTWTLTGLSVALSIAQVVVERRSRVRAT
jgi:hypothetical protein